MRRRYGLGFKPGMRATDDERYLTSLNFVGKTVYDIGGYVGIYTLFFAHAAGPDGHVVAFEPNPQNYRELQLNVQLNKFTNVTAIQSAIGAHCGNIALHVDPLAPARGFIAGARDDLPLKKRARVPVELWSLDNMIAQRGLTPPDL
ncbi:MAG: FkbM family methyltransferase [Rhodospirillales bacterium]|nr:FkbM family methyltransferase [Rhodospirillales bacterium]